jgi:hypothetical protein
MIREKRPATGQKKVGNVHLSLHLPILGESVLPVPAHLREMQLDEEKMGCFPSGPTLDTEYVHLTALQRWFYTWGSDENEAPPDSLSTQQWTEAIVDIFATIGRRVEHKANEHKPKEVKVQP